MTPVRSTSITDFATSDGDVMEYTRQVQTILATEVLRNNMAKIRINAISLACGYGKVDKLFQVSKKIVVKYIIKRIFELRSSDDEIGVFLKKMSENEIAIIVSGVLTHIKMYQLGFKNSVEHSVMSEIMDKEKYCNYMKINIDNLSSIMGGKND